MARGDVDRMADLSFRMMAATMAVKDFLFPSVAKRVASFGIREGQTVVDYGCGPGRYIPEFSKRVGARGQVYAVDVQELALDYVRRKIEEQHLGNVHLVLAHGYHADIPTGAADVICVLDMIFGVRDPLALLEEVHRIVKPDGMLILDDGHQARRKTLQMIETSGKWRITRESRDHLVCAPVNEETL